MNVNPDHLSLRMGGNAVCSKARRGGDLRSVLDVARRQRWLILAVCTLCLATAIVYVVTATRMFTASTMLVIDTKMTPPAPTQVSAEGQIDPAVVESQVEILKSDKIALDVVDRLGLDQDPEFIGAGPGLVGRLSAYLLPDQAPGEPADPRQIAATGLKQKVKILRSGRSFLAEIKATTQEPKKSATIANGVADAYIQDQLNSRLEASQRTADWMQRRLRDVQKDAARADAALQAFRAAQRPEAVDAAAQPGAPPQSDAEQQLEQAATAARGTYASLQNRITRVTAFLQQQAMPVTEARIVTAAAPPLSKSSPQTTLVLLLAIAGGLTAGLAAAFLREMFDRRVRWAAQITDELGLPYLGALPKAAGGRLQSVRRGRRAATPLLITDPSTAPVAIETLRSAKIVIDQATGRARCAVVGVISASEQDGKATVATNLAALVIQMRARVLLIDANLHGSRFGSPTAALGAGHGIGITEAVTAGHQLAGCVVPTEYGFDLLSGKVGVSPAHPTEILASSGLRRLIAEARDSYDYVVVTIPAVLSTVDVRAIEDIADAFILTVASGRTTLDDVEAMFAACPVLFDRVIGVILNRSTHVSKRRLRRRVLRSRILELTA
jgi:uncharacterized protein involved in exopolysaccharide biosynthesis/Mrp family chromosome partitioning ATPase